MRWFNTAGPCKPDIHHMLPAQHRMPAIERLIDQQGYFVIHAPRQTGKTTAMLTLVPRSAAAYASGHTYGPAHVTHCTGGTGRSAIK
jgi:hypothetical protein